MFITGTFVFANYLSRFANKDSDEEEEYFSEPIMVEGVCYRLRFFPQGWDDGTETHISVGIHRTKLSCLNLDASDKVENVTTLVHSSGAPGRNHIFRSKDDWAGKDDYAMVES